MGPGLVMRHWEEKFGPSDDGTGLDPWHHDRLWGSPAEGLIRRSLRPGSVCSASLRLSPARSRVY
jgi:hypothetical protein